MKAGIELSPPFLHMRFLTVAGLLLAGCSSETLHDRLLGTWKSNEAMTLATIGNADHLSPEQRAMLESDFFGHLVISYERDTWTSYMDNSDRPPVTQEYVVIIELNDLMRICERDQTGDCPEYELRFEGDCYYVDISDGRGFVEYFCRVDE